MRVLKIIFGSEKYSINKKRKCKNLVDFRHRIILNDA